MSSAVPSYLAADLESALEQALRAGRTETADVVGEVDEVDGRRLRAERGRSAVLNAALELVDSGNPAPTIAEIAEASGVSERTIFRYFPDRDALFSALVFEVIPRIARYLSFDRPDGALAERVERLVSQRCEFVRVAGPFARSVETLSPACATRSSSGSARNSPPPTPDGSPCSTRCCRVRSSNIWSAISVSGARCSRSPTRSSASSTEPATSIRTPTASPRSRCRSQRRHRIADRPHADPGPAATAPPTVGYDAAWPHRRRRPVSRRRSMTGS
ncbi:MAG: TetR/AcrR family transcriptional regulator [Actinobacteria bacterium]|nr:TetR/AcrR family transcriptional regulator [Actinomycetota bacterium]